MRTLHDKSYFMLGILTLLGCYNFQDEAHVSYLQDLNLHNIKSKSSNKYKHQIIIDNINIYELIIKNIQLMDLSWLSTCSQDTDLKSRVFTFAGQKLKALLADFGLFTFQDLNKSKKSDIDLETSVLEVEVIDKEVDDKYETSLTILDIAIGFTDFLSRNKVVIPFIKDLSIQDDDGEILEDKNSSNIVQQVLEFIYTGVYQTDTGAVIFFH